MQLNAVAFQNPDRPKRPLNAFVLWYRDNKQRLLVQNPKNPRDVHDNYVKRTARIAATEWKRLPDAQKARYRQQMEEGRRLYAQLKTAYDKKMKSHDG
jgi:hypothetical protein